MERLAGAVERFVGGSGGRVEVSKCRAVLGTAFAGVGRSWVVGMMTGRAVRGGVGWLGRLAGLRKRSEAECGACGFGRVGLSMSKGGERASMVALPQPAANGSLCGGGSELGGWGDDGSGCAGQRRLAWASGRLRKRSEAENSAWIWLGLLGIC